MMMQPNGSKCQWKAHPSAVRSLCFIENYRCFDLLTGSDDHLIKRWKKSDTSGYKCVATLKGHSAAVRCVRSKKAFIISASEDSTVRVWPGLMLDIDDDGNPDTVLRGHSGIVTCCDLSSCETMAVSGATDRVSIRILAIVWWQLLLCDKILHFNWGIPKKPFSTSSGWTVEGLNICHHQ